MAISAEMLVTACFHYKSHFIRSKESSEQESSEVVENKSTKTEPLKRTKDIFDREDPIFLALGNLGFKAGV